VKIGTRCSSVRRPRPASFPTRRIVGGGLRRPGHHHHRQVRDAVAPYLGRFNFKGQDQQKLVATSRVASRRLHPPPCYSGARAASRRPSNDLDVETLAPSDALTNSGLVMVISTIAGSRRIRPTSRPRGRFAVYFYQGKLREYEENKHERLGEEAAARSPALQPLH